MTSPTDLTWPTPPEIVEPTPQGTRRAWGKVPYEERYRRQRQDLLRAAARIASRNGLSATRISDVVAEAGVSKGTFYEHFASKDECFLELYRTTNAGMLRAGIRAAETNFDRGAYATILSVVRALTGFVAQDLRLAHALSGEVAANHSIRDEALQHRDRIVDLFVVVARRLRSPLPDADAALAAKVFVNGVIAMLSELHRAPGAEDAFAPVARVGCRALGLDDAALSEPAPLDGLAVEPAP